MSILVVGLKHPPTVKEAQQKHDAWVLSVNDGCMYMCDTNVVDRDCVVV